MKLIKDEHTNKWELYFGDHFIHILNDWKQLRGKYNWYSFHFIYIYFEKDMMLDGYEFEFMILGLGFRIRWNYADEDNEIIKAAKEAEKELKAIKSLKDLE